VSGFLISWDPLRHLPPRRHALGLQELRQVVEDDDRPGILAVRPAQRRRGGEQREGGAAPAQLELELGAGGPGPPRPAHLGHQRPELGAREDVLDEAPHRRRLVDTQHAGGGAVDGRQAPEWIEGNDAGGDGLEDGFDIDAAVFELGVLVRQVEVGLLELMLGPGQIVGHPVERLDEHADLVVAAARRHLVGEVAGGDLARALRELLDGSGDPARQVQAEPREREDDDQRHEQEEQNVDALDRRLQELELLELPERLRDAAHPRLEAIGDVGAHHHHADHVALAALRHPDRHDRLDEVAGGELAHGGELLPGDALPQLVLVDILRREVAEDRVLHVDQLLARRAEDGDGADPEPVLLLDEVGGQRLPPRLGEEPVAIDHTADVLGVPQGRALEIRVVRLRHRQGLIQRLLHLGLEPPLDRFGDEVRRDQEDQHRGDEGQREERHHQLRLELGADHLLAPLEPQLDEVAEEQQHQEQQHDQVQVEQGEDGNA